MDFQSVWVSIPAAHNVDAHVFLNILSKRGRKICNPNLMLGRGESLARNSHMVLHVSHYHDISLLRNTFVVNLRVQCLYGGRHILVCWQIDTKYCEFAANSHCAIVRIVLG